MLAPAEVLLHGGTDVVHLCTEAGLRSTVFGAASLTASLIGTPRGTTNCCYEHARQNLSVVGV
jgi:hypothetical protein